MRIVRLTPDRVRVFLSECDLSEMQIDIEGLTPDAPGLDVFLRDILEEVKRETGFSLGDGRVLAEATPEENGIVIDLSHIPEEKRSTRDVTRIVKKESVVFEFSGFEALSELLKHISAHNLLNMRLYSLKGNFYMAVPKRRVPALMYEYSLKNNKSSVAEIKLSEHGRFIAGGYRLMYMGAMLKKIN